MSSEAKAPDPAVRDVPSMLDLVRMSRTPRFPPGGEELYRHIAVLTELSEGDEVLDAACGSGVTLEYFVKEYGVHGSGVDHDPAMVERAEDRIREEGLSDRVQFQHGEMENLPYRDEIFDLALGEMGMTARADPERALEELVRVTRPGGTVALIQLVWKAPVDEARRRILSEHLGARPLMLVELKRILRASGVRHLHTEDWSDEETAFRGRVTKPFPDFAELFSIFEKLGILRRAWSRWGWNGVRTALLREREVHRLLTRERVIGLDLLMGTKVACAGEEAPAHEPATSAARVRKEVAKRASGTDAGAEEAGVEEGAPGDEGVRTGPTPEERERPDEEEAEEEARGAETVGLPLFRSEEAG